MKLICRCTGMTATILSFAALLCAQPKPPTQTPTKTSTKAPRAAIASTGAVPVGVQVLMSDGSVQTYPLGIYLQFQGTILRGIFPTQYVNQNAVLQPDNSWKYPKPGRNVQIWRNGVLQRPGADYNLDQANATVIPLTTWAPDDYVTAAYLF